jgi:hypothetical protein
VFSQPQIEKLFNNFVTVRLYTDRLPPGVPQVPNAQESKEFRDEKLKNVALPYYVILKPKGKTLEKIAAYEQGLISSEEEFAGFLNKALEAGKKS